MGEEGLEKKMSFWVKKMKALKSEGQDILDPRTMEE